MKTNWSNLARQLLGGGAKEVASPSDAGGSLAPRSASSSMTDGNMSHASTHSIDIGKQQVATVYAKALLGAAVKERSDETVVAEFGEFVTKIVARVPGLRSVLESPRISAEEKNGILDRSLQGRVSGTLLRFLKVVGEHDRLDCLDQIYSETQRLYWEMKSVVHLHLTTATPIDGKSYGAVVETLKQKFGTQIEVETHVDPALIGGAVVRIGDKVYDGSVRQNMRSLQEEAVAKTVETLRNSTDQFATSG